MEIEETLCGRMDGRTDGQTYGRADRHLKPTLLGRLGVVDVKKTNEDRRP